jgi:hypothetical protein
MMRQFVLLVILLTVLASCGSSVDTRFGFESISLMAYNWVNAPSTSRLLGRPVITFRTSAVDTPMSIIVVKYVQVNDSGVCRLAKSKQWGGPLEFSHLLLPSSCDSILKNVERLKLANAYSPPDGHVEMDEGPAFCILIERKDGSRQFIKYHHAFIPESLRRIHSLLYDLDSPVYTDTSSAPRLQVIADSIGSRDASGVKKAMARPIVGAPISL